MATLADYYKSQGQSLPSVGQRQSVASQAGISGYTGTSQQNNQLLSYLQKGSGLQTPKSPVITTSALAPVQPVNIPTQGNPSGLPQNNQSTTMPLDVPTSMPAVLPNYPDTQLETIATQKTDNQKFEENSIYKLLDLQQSQLGESAMLQQQQEQQGVFAKEAEYRKISDQIRTRQAQTAQERAQINKSPMSFAARSGYEAAVQAANDSEVGALNAQAQAVAGEYEMAVNTAQRAVDAKYKPEKEKIALIKAQLEAIKPLLDADQKKQAEERLRANKLEDRAYDEKIDFEKNLATMTITALAAGAPQSVIDASKQAKTTLEAAQILGRYSPETLKYELLKEQIKTERAQRAKINADINKTNNPTGSLADIKDFQVQNAGFADRINMSNQILDTNIDTLKSMNYAQFKLATSTSPLASKALSPAQKQVALAMRNFITAKLRKESGASILPTEFADARAQYFPTIGDDDVTISNKKALRDSTLNNLIVGSGGAYQPTQLQTNEFTNATGTVNQSIDTTYMDIKPNGSFDWKLPNIKGFK